MSVYSYGISYEEMKEIYEDERLGIMDSPNFDKIQVYPNPVKDNLVIDLKTKPGGMVSVSLYSIMGQKVIAVELIANKKGFVKQTLDFTKFRPGTYVLKAEAEVNIYVRKIIVTE